MLKCPLTLWLKRSIINNYLILSNKSKYLNIGYGTSVSRTSFGNHNFIYENCLLSNCEIGDFTYIAPGTHVSRTKVGSFCSIGPECRIGLGKHPTKDFISTHPIFFSLGKQAGITFSDDNYYDEFDDIEIGHDVWLGTRVIIVDGVKIGNGAIVAAGSVVTKNIPPYAIVGGVPAKVIRYRFTDDQISLIEESRWWEADPILLKAKFDRFHSFNSFLSLIPEIKKQ